MEEQFKSADSWGLPSETGLYDPRHEKDACGIGFVAHVRGDKCREIIAKGIQILVSLKHRGAAGSDPETGDGAGLLTQLPHTFLSRECSALGFNLPAEGHYAAGMILLPLDPAQQKTGQQLVESKAKAEGLGIIGWREVPVDPNAVGKVAQSTRPAFFQVFISRPSDLDTMAFERKLFVMRRLIEKSEEARSLPVNMLSLSSRTIVYKGLLLAPQIDKFFLDLQDPEFKSAICLVHQRFSTNTFPTWALAHPFRMVAHNGEINTIKGNVKWMQARSATLQSTLFGDELDKAKPILDEGLSDSASFDRVLELLTLSGRSLPHAVAMMVPEAWTKNEAIDDEVRAFYDYHSTLMEPWDGPAAIGFTDGRYVGAVQDRNGLRPARCLETTDGFFVMASETGALPIPPQDIIWKGRIKPGRMVIVDTEEGRVMQDRELKKQLASRRPYKAWIREHRHHLATLPESARIHEPNEGTMLMRQLMNGWTEEDIRMILRPMAATGKEPTGSMGADTPLACMSEQPQPLFSYFRQLFAQVTNPPIDPIREELVMSLGSTVGRARNLLDETPEHCHTLTLDQPILANEELEKLRRVSTQDLLATTLNATYVVDEGGKGLRRAVRHLCRRAALAVKNGYTILILSSRGSDEEYAPIPSLMATAAVHNHLIKEGLRSQTALIVESGEPREVMHFALLIGYGASAVNPYLALETITTSVHSGHMGEIDSKKAVTNYIDACGQGLLKIFSKMGISTQESYRGAQVFEAVGLDQKFINEFFDGTPSRLCGIGIEEIAQEATAKHRAAIQSEEDGRGMLPVAGEYQHRVQGEKHLLNPAAVSKLQHAVNMDSQAKYDEYAKEIDEQNERLCTIRGALEFKSDRKPISIDEVEPAKEIVKRFSTGAMSFGSISKEAHETLALAMNEIGGKSNTGEGGEDEERFTDQRRSAIKQIASGRFGVTASYLVNADELQIKMAQGAKPGEGGHLPGRKVNQTIADVRNSVAGVGLISPPPHHDIYSIEDLAQLIADLKCVNPKARLSVKLVSEVGVGTVAAGVAKAYSDVIVISGGSGGTGAAPLSSIRHAGVPWELGLAEAQQVLVKNGLRDRVRLQTDGKMLTGRDVLTAAMFGAEEFGFSTAPLIAMGCIMMRKCHLNTCPVGIATQDPLLREKFRGKPEHVVRFMFAVAEHARQLMAELGYKTLDELIGRADLLSKRKIAKHLKASKLDLSAMLEDTSGPGSRWCGKPNLSGEPQLDEDLIAHAKDALDEQIPVKVRLPIKNQHRSVGAGLSGEVARRFGSAGLPDETIRCEFDGSAGQSFGAFLSAGTTFVLEGDANDGVGKCMSGGRIVIRPPQQSLLAPDESAIIGNTALYGASSGEAFFNGRAGERFAIRCSGAHTVVEGVGDHACEYMTGGVVVVLGGTGRNFAAGMSGGIAYVYDPERKFRGGRCCLDMVSLTPVQDAEDVRLLHSLINRHAEWTDSPAAKRVIDNWSESLPDFVKVYPHDFRRVIEAGTAQHPAEVVG